MAPYGNALPQATTESAREARKAFFCELCQKGYARMNEFETHEGSYDHQHRKRLKEMRQLSKDSNTITKARAADQRENGDFKAISVPLTGKGSNSTKKKPVFLSTAPSKMSNQQSAPVFSAVSGPPVTTDRANLAEREDFTVDEFDNDIDRDDLDCAKYNGWQDTRYDPFKYSQFIRDAVQDLDDDDGQHMSDHRLRDWIVGKSFITAENEWNDEKQRELDEQLAKASWLGSKPKQSALV